MKNKKLTYFLVVVVIVVWGLIIYRLVGSFDNGDDTTNIAPPVSKKEPFNDYNIPKDTSRLMLNYRDPFGIVKFKDTVKIIAETRKTRTISPVKPAIDWGFIRYSGYIRNPDSKQLIALIQINGKSADMKEGDIFDHVKLIKNMQDSVKVLFNGKTKFITIQHS